jgi:plasmid stability protein
MKEAVVPNVLVRDLSDKALARLKARAGARGRPLQAELKGILEQAAKAGPDIATLAARIRRRLGGRRHSDSARLIAADRAR